MNLCYITLNDLIISGFGIIIITISIILIIVGIIYAFINFMTPIYIRKIHKQLEYTNELLENLVRIEKYKNEQIQIIKYDEIE